MLHSYVATYSVKYILATSYVNCVKYIHLVIHNIQSVELYFNSVLIIFLTLTVHLKWCFTNAEFLNQHFLILQLLLFTFSSKSDKVAAKGCQ